MLAGYHRRIEQFFNYITELEIKIERFKVDRRFCFTTEMRQANTIKVKRLQQALEHAKELYKQQLQNTLKFLEDANK